MTLGQGASGQGASGSGASGCIGTLHAEWAETAATAWEALEPAIQGSTLVLITVEAGSDYIVTDACDD